MRMAKTCGVTRISIYGDSNLVVQQAMRDCDAVAENMMAYQKLYNTLEGGFDGCELNYVNRANNTEADELANIGSTRGPIPPRRFPRKHQPKVNQNQGTHTGGSRRG